MTSMLCSSTWLTISSRLLTPHRGARHLSGGRHRGRGRREGHHHLRPLEAVNLRPVHTSSGCEGKRNDPVKFTDFFGPPLSSSRSSSVNGSGHVVTKPSQLFKPVRVRPNPDDINVGHALSGGSVLNKSDLLKKLNAFYLRPQVREVAKEHGLDEHLYHQAYVSFRKFCMDTQHLPAEMYLLFSDLLRGHKHVDDIFPFFLQHAKKVFPHLDCLDELRKVGDLTDPALWYPEARALNRRVIFHAGPTNSGKTYHALERFMTAKSGIYCGPLKLLAVEVFNKVNGRGVPCDLVTGEDRRFAIDAQTPANHVACTIEMASFNHNYEVAVIDEIQMTRDLQRGWAWTRALLGLPAEEIHVCGEAAAIDLVRELMISTGDEVDVHTYNRLTSLVVEDEALGRLENVQPGDCIVCFNKQDIYSVSRSLERLGHECAVIYGSLPPATKLSMAERFNDPQDSCKVMVATDAVGMGLNLNIRRIIFFSLTKLQLLPNGEKEMDRISVSQALQIAGRAGRYATQWETGFVTCFNHDELKTLKELLKRQPEPLLTAGIAPTYDQIETYAYHLPHASLANLVDIFLSLSTLDDSMYSLCQMDDFKFLADMLEHIKLPLKAKYTFCCAPINRRMPLICTMFLKITRQFSKGSPITFDWLCHQLGWPFAPPATLLDLIHLEAVHDVFDVYLWLSYRFTDMFPDAETVRSVQLELDDVISDGVTHIVQLLRNSESGVTSGLAQAKEDVFEAKDRRQKRLKRWNHHKTDNSNDSDDQESNDATKRTDHIRESSRGSPSFSGIAASSLSPKDSSLSSQLLEQGLLTKAQINELKKEWKREQLRDNDNADYGNDGRS